MTDTIRTAPPSAETTVLPAAADGRPPVAADERRRPPGELRVRLHRVTPEGTATLLGSMAGAVALTWVLYERVLPTSGALGFWLCCYAVFLGLYATSCVNQWGTRAAVDRVVAVAVGSACLGVLALLIDLIGYTAYRGIDALAHLNFFTDTMSDAGPLSSLQVGGAVHAMIGSLEQLALATAFSVPLGILAAVFMSEMGGPLARLVRIFVDAMTALPSIVAGLFILSLWIVTFRLGQSGFAAALAIAVMMMPIVTRASDLVLQLVPSTLREAAYAMGASQWRVVWSVVLPTARSGLTTAVVLAMARGIGETSPVLLTAGFTKDLNTNPFSGQQANLPVYIWTYVHYPQATYISRGFGAGLTLMIVVLVLFVTARLLGGKPPGEISRRQQRRIARTARRVDRTKESPA